MSNPFMPIRRVRKAVPEERMSPMLTLVQNIAVQPLPAIEVARKPHAPGPTPPQYRHVEVDRPPPGTSMTFIAASLDTHRKAGNR